MTVTSVQLNPESGEFEDGNKAPSPSNGVHSPDAPAKVPAQVQVGGITYRAGAGPNEVMSSTKVEQFSSLDLKSDRPGILASAMTPWGSPARELTPETRIELKDGMVVDLKTAQAMGLVERVNGEYREVQQVAPTPQEDTSNADIMSQSVKLSADGSRTTTAKEVLTESTKAIQASMNGIDPFFQDQIIHRLFTDKMDEVAVHDIAAANNMSTEELQARIDVFWAGWGAEVAVAANRHGIVDLQHFANWADENYSDSEMMDAQMAHLHGRDFRAYDKMMERYMREVLPTTASVEKIGVKVSKGKDGKELVNVGGMQMSLAAAVRMGFIK